jgi:hypothetical protein
MAFSVDKFISFNYDRSLEFINQYKVNINSKVNFNHYKTIINNCIHILSVKIDVLKAEMLIVNNCLPTNFILEDMKDKIKKDSFPNVYQLLQIVITIPISSATCERSFSIMQWIKTS